MEFRLHVRMLVLEYFPNPVDLYSPSANIALRQPVKLLLAFILR